MVDVDIHINEKVRVTRSLLEEGDSTSKTLKQYPKH
jgi:hypothetical protein